MKKTLFLLCMFYTFICATLNAQVAQAIGCSSIEVSSLPPFPQDIFGQGVGVTQSNDGSGCSYLITTLGSPSSSIWKPRYFLQRKIGNVWLPDRPVQLFSSRFDNLQLGATYRIDIQLPAYKPEQCNLNFDGRTPCYWKNGRGEFIGFFGQWGATVSTNEITAGATQLSDNVSNFVDVNGVKIFPDANGNSSFFADGEEVRINTAASKNYDWYFMAILEEPANGSQGRWRALGNGGNGEWRQGPMPTTLSLTDLWSINGGTNWTFTSGNSYRLQIALSKNICSSWTEVISNFYICPTGWACRTGGEKKAENKIVLSPNPASNKFRLDGVNFADVKNCDVFISDISGREIQRFKDVNTNEFALNGLSNGIYIVSITADNRRLFSSKLVVNN